MRRRILLLVVGMTALVLTAVAVPIAVLVGKEVIERGKQDTVQQASKVGLYLQGASRTSAQVRSYVTDLTARTGRPTSVVGFDRVVIGTLPPDGTGLAAAGRGTSGIGAPPTRDTTPGGIGGGAAGDNGPGNSVRGGDRPQLVDVPGGVVAVLYSGYSTNGYFIRVFATQDKLRSGETGWLLLLAAGSVAMLLLAAGAGELLTRRIVRPLLDTATTAQKLGSGDTAARAPTDGPQEIADVGRALNRLADRIDQLIAEERETAADVSHRLRTPLTALRLDAEALRDPAEAERVGMHVTALERMLTAVIHAARRPQREGRMPSCDAAAVVGERVRFWSALADDQRRTGRVDVPSKPIPVRAGAEDLAAAVDALLENVIAHTPEGTDYGVRLVPAGDGAELTVDDDGPGLPRDEPVRGRSDRGSSGLGLDIARRCAVASGGSMTLGSSPSGGTSITLTLGAP